MSTISSTSSSTSGTTTSSTSTDYKDFNTTELVEAKLASRYTRRDSLSSKVTANDTRISAYRDMQDKLQSVTAALETLRGNPSTTGKAADVFRDRTGYLTSSTATAAGTYMSASVAEGTDLGSHTITIERVAKANILGTAAQSSKYDALGWSGSFTLGTDAGGSAAITVSATMSLGDVADAINAQKDNTGVKASVMKVSDSAYQLVLTSTETGRTITAADVSGGLLADKLGLLDGSGAIDTDQVLQDAQNAQFTVDGVTMTRRSNDVDDVLDGVTLHLYAAPATDTTLTLEVDHDLSGIKNAITGFVEAYNTFRDFVVANQNTASDGTADGDATLFGDATLRAIANAVQDILASGVGEDNLRAIGITLDENNKLEVDETTLNNALQDDIDGVQALFSYSMTTSSGDLGLVRHPDKSMNFTLDVTVDGSGNLTGAGIGGDSSMFTISGNTITGKDGTDYEGLTLVYTGTTSKAITVLLSQGIADQLFSEIDKVSNADSGTLNDQIETLENSNDDLNDRISSLESSISSYRQALTTLYSNMAAKVASAQNTVDLLKAFLNTNSSS